MKRSGRGPLRSCGRKDLRKLWSAGRPSGAEDSAAGAVASQRFASRTFRTAANGFPKMGDYVP